MFSYTRKLKINLNLKNEASMCPSLNQYNNKWFAKNSQATLLFQRQMKILANIFRFVS